MGRRLISGLTKGVVNSRKWQMAQKLLFVNSNTYGDKMLGKITDFYPDKGYCFITGEDGRKYFLSHPKNAPNPTKDQVVSFDIKIDIHGRSNAKNVRNIRNQGSFKILRELSKWRRESKLEDNEKYFFKIPRIDDIENGHVSFVLGRKGTGKTAIGEYLTTNVKPGRFAHKLSFKDVSFDHIRQKISQTNEVPNQAVSLFKYLIYSNIAFLMTQNNSINARVREEIEAGFGEALSVEGALSSVFRNTIGTKVSGSVMSFGGGFEKQIEHVKNDSDWRTRSEILEKYLKENIDSSSYTIVFDELDDSYNVYQDGRQRDLFLALIAALFKAVFDIKAKFKGDEYAIQPVVLLRDDIFDQLEDSEKTKWNDLTLRLTWHTQLLKNLLAFRISRAIDPKQPILDFDQAWARVFQSDPMIRPVLQAPDRDGFKTTTESVFLFLKKRTLGRPRDFIVCLKECADTAIDSGSELVSEKLVLISARRISKFIREEFEDELGGKLPEIKQIFQVLFEINKPFFTAKEFSESYIEKMNALQLKPRNPTEVLRILFDGSVLGNQTLDGNRVVFKYMDPKLGVIPNGTFNVFRGLYESLQLV